MGLDIYLIEPCVQDMSTGSITLKRGNILNRVSTYFKGYIEHEPIEYIDWIKLFKRRGLNYNDYELYSSCGRKYDFIPKNKIGSDLEDIDFITFNTRINSPCYTEIEPVLYYKEVGYQRKGANARFYSEGVWDTGGFIVTGDEAALHYLNYFNRSFRTNILSKFIQGENMICYW